MAAYQYIFVMKNLSKKFPGGKEVLKDLSLSFFPGAKIGVLGANGAGKTTLLKIMAGLEKDFEGEAWAADGVKTGYLSQEPQLDPSKNVMENIMDGVGEVKELLDRFEIINNRFAEEMSDDEMNELIVEQGDVQEKIDACDGWDIERTIEIAMDALRCPPANADVTNLSGGEKRRVALCRLLLSKPDMLMLDEPTNHLDAESVAWLEMHLREYPGTVVMVTHDRYFLDNITGWILELDRGQGIPYEGNYTSWLEQKEKRLEHEKREESSRQKTIKEELKWIQQGARARQSKSKSRIASFDALVAKAAKRGPDNAQIIIPQGERLGDLVLEAKDLSKGYESKLLIDGLDFKIPPGGIVGIIGANGAGKTTLLRMIVGQEKADSGTIKLGDTIKLGYVDQSRNVLDDSRTVWEEISEGEAEVVLGKRKMQSRAYVGQFNFKGVDQQKKVGQLSGGERNRVHLAKMLKTGSNVIILDEPTNDLDVDTLRALEEALLEFPGCAIVTSHDRWFLDRIATHILAFEGDSKTVWFEGNYADYEADKKRRLGDEALIPHRIKYKKLTR